MTSTVPAVPPVTEPPTSSEALAVCVATFQRHLHMPDPGAVLVSLATVAANRAEGDPLWLLLVGPPGGGKTEVLGAFVGLEDVYPVATLTEPALLSGTPAKDKASTAKGGLLREIGDFGLIVCKDFGSVLSMHREARAAVLAALREIYDGAWTRHVGSDGGRSLAWSGKVGVIGGCTPSIDSHNAVMGSLGERFVLFRLPKIDQDRQARKALLHLGTERQMRSDLVAAVRVVLDMVDKRALTAAPDEHLTDRLVKLSTLAVRCRSAVERDNYSREVDLIPDAEAPARLALVLLRLHNGLVAIGADPETTERLVSKCALDSMPQLRRKVLEQLVKEPDLNTSQLADLIGYPTSTTRRGCEDLTGHGVLERTPGGQGKADIWSVAEWARSRWPSVPETSDNSGESLESVPETSDNSVKGQENGKNPTLFTTTPNSEEDKSGKVAADDAPPLTDEDIDGLEVAFR